MGSGENAVKMQTSPSEVKDCHSEAERLRAVLDRADTGEKIALAEVREMLRANPPAIALLGGDLAERAETLLVERIAEGQPVFRAALLAKLEALRADLAGPAPSPTERLLVERVVATWLQMAHADALAAQAERGSHADGEYNQRRQDRAHRRYLSAVKMLAVVRKLALPIRVDVNVGGSIETKSTEQTASTRRRWLPVPTRN